MAENITKAVMWGTSPLWAPFAVATGNDPGDWVEKTAGFTSGVQKDITDVFSPDLPDLPPTPDPVAQQSTLAATQAEERSLINRAGLAGTKKVRSLLGKTDSLGGGGSGV